MCGITGIADADEAVVRRALAEMDYAQRHRGPDGHGQFVDTFGDVVLGLGHRRLSILDISPLGNQPMVHPATGDVIVFNGEIYNFRALRRELEQEGERFASSGEKEVLLRGLTRHGEHFMKRLQGMFAFAFLCRRTRRLLLARDPMGIKPLYFSIRHRQLLFASEVRAIAGTGLVDLAIDEASVGGFLACGAFQQPATIFRNIRMMMPGHCMWFDLDTKQMSAPRQYWHFPGVATALTEPEAIEELRGLLSVSVRDHLESDVPVGVFLSSGVDSTAVAGLASEHSGRVRSFTVGFGDHTDFSEADLAAETAALFGLEHTAIAINSDAAVDVATEWMTALDQPSVDGLNVFLLAKVVRAHGITVALSGLGGDEMFGGYPSFVDVPFFAKVIPRMRWMPRLAKDTLARALAAGRSLAYREKLRSILCSDGSIEALYLLRRRIMSDEQMRSLGSDPTLATPEALLCSPVADVVRMVPDEIASISRLEAMIYQGNMLLRDSDTNGMAHGLEIRVPLLDQRVVDFAARLPGRMLLPKGSGPKYLLRKSCADLLRPAVLNQPKMGFTLPIRRWMSGPLRAMCEEAIEYLGATGLLDSRGVRAVWASFLREPETPMWSRAFTLVVLGHYLKHVVPRNREATK